MAQPSAAGRGGALIGATQGTSGPVVAGGLRALMFKSLLNCYYVPNSLLDALEKTPSSRHIIK